MPDYTCNNCGKKFYKKKGRRKNKDAAYCNRGCYIQFCENRHCKEEDCKNEYYAKDYCSKHYTKFLGPAIKKKYQESHPDYVQRQREGTRKYQKRMRSIPEVNAILNAKTKEWREKLKIETFVAYGGLRCNCCGEIEYDFLQLDHINGGGTQHRKRLKNSSAYTIYYSLKKSGFPSGYQILCANCNSGRAKNNGICPHKIEERQYA